jgi:hypothetical protein
MNELISEDIWPQFYCAFECHKKECPCSDPSELKSNQPYNKEG